MTLIAASLPYWVRTDAPDFSAWLYDGWASLLRVVVVGLLAYVGLIVMLRVSGKRTLSKMNAFDLIVTVALGSTLATTLLGNGVALAEGMTAFGLLIVVQFAVAWTCARSDWADSLVKAKPTILLWRGEMLRDVMRKERVTEEEVLCAVRASGRSGYGEVGAVILETTGDFSVVGAIDHAGERVSTLENVTHRPGDK